MNKWIAYITTEGDVVIDNGNVRLHVITSLFKQSISEHLAYAERLAELLNKPVSKLH